MKPLRIIIVMIEPPLPFGNAASRWFYVLLKGLVERGHNVTAFAACSKSEEIEKAKAIFPDSKYDLRCFPFPQSTGLSSKINTLIRPYSNYFNDELRQSLDRELAMPFDILHLEQMWTGWLGLKNTKKAILNIHHLVWIDLELTKPTAIRSRIEQAMMFSTEERLLRSYKYIRSCSPRLTPEIMKVNPHAQITNIPVGIDTSLYDFIPDSKRTSIPTVTLIGTMSWYPGYSAAVRLLTKLWASIKLQVPNANLQIIGWNARTALSEFLELPDVEIKENVPDTKPYFESTSVFLYAPARGSGMKIKILEAFAFGIPVVTTSEGIEGLAAEDGIHAGIADDDAGLILRTVQLLKDPIKQSKQRKAGRDLLEQHCSPQVTLNALEQAYEIILGN
jgi:polysaccharide biosynthesis protein PslH